MADLEDEQPKLGVCVLLCVWKKVMSDDGNGIEQQRLRELTPRLKSETNSDSNKNHHDNTEQQVRENGKNTGEAEVRREVVICFIVLCFLSVLSTMQLMHGPDIILTLDDGPRPTTEPKTIVFGVGLTMTGTRSMSAAFEMLGYTTTIHSDTTVSSYMHHANETANLHDRYSRNKHDDNDDDVYGISVWDVPTAAYYVELLTAYPDAKFVLTTRDSESWYTALEQHINEYQYRSWGCKMPERVQRLNTYVYGSPYPNRNWIQSYEQHNENVKSYFANVAPDQLLHIDVSERNKWNKICSSFVGSSGVLIGGGPCSITSYVIRTISVWILGVDHSFPQVEDDEAPSEVDYGDDDDENDNNHNLRQRSCTQSDEKDQSKVVDQSKGKFAYVMMLCDPANPDQVDYVRMLLVLKENIRSFDNSTDFVVLVKGSITNELVDVLEEEEFNIQRVSSVGIMASNPEPNRVPDDRAECYQSKLNAANLTMCERVMFLDNDILTWKNLQSFFIEKYEFVAYDGHDSPLNAGLFVLSPSVQTFVDLVDIASTDAFDPQDGWLSYGPFRHWRLDGEMSDWSFWCAHTDQGILYYYFDKLMDDATILSRLGNSDVYTHFTGTNKPYMHDPKNLSSVKKRYRDGIIEWYRLWSVVEERLAKHGIEFRSVHMR